MKIDKIQITVKELINGYIEKGAGGIEGIVAYDRQMLCSKCNITKSNR